MQHFMNLLSTSGLDIVYIILAACLLYAAGPVVLAYLVRSTIRRTKQRSWHQKDIEKRGATITGLVVNIWRILILVCSVTAIILAIFPNISLAPLFASAGIIGVAIGFGAQSMAKDFITGLFIIGENQFRVGDIIEIDGAAGTVERISTRSTVLRDVDGNVHYFPNGMIQHVINKTMGFGMARFTIAIHPDENIDRVIEVINAVGQELTDDPVWHKKIIEPPSFSMIGEFSANSVSLIIAGKTQPSDQWSVVAAMRRKLLEAFDEHGIKLGSVPAIAAQAVTKKR